MVQHYLTEQDSRALQRVMQPGETTSPDRDLAIPSTLPLLGKADADIAKFMLGTFTLQKLKPDALADSTIKRDAYALSAIKLGELVSLFRYAGEASQGFWAASAVGTPLTTQECFCLIKTLLEENLTLTDAEIADLAAKCSMCVDPPATPVSDCSGNDIRDSFSMSFGGWVDTTLTRTVVTPDDWIADFKLSQLNGQSILWDDIDQAVPLCAYQHTPIDVAFDVVPQTAAAAAEYGVNIGDPAPLTYVPKNATIDRVNGYNHFDDAWNLDIFFNQGTGGRVMDLFNPSGTGVFPGAVDIPPDQIGYSFLWNADPGEPVGSGNVTFA